MRAAVLHYHLAVDVTGGIRNQKTRKIRKLAMFADAAERVPRGPVFVAALGPKLTGSTGCRKRAGRDGDGSNPLGSPVDSQTVCHGEIGRVGDRRRHGESA